MPILLRSSLGHGAARSKDVSAATFDCDKALQIVKEAGITLIAIDFDMTIIDIHTGGVWQDTATNLVPHVRPEFQCFISGLLDNGRIVTVATFSTQTDLILDVIQKAIQHERVDSIAVFGGDDTIAGFERGKQSQLYHSIQYANQDYTTAQNSAHPQIAQTTILSTLLVDDDPTNIEVAIAAGYKTMQYIPGQSLLSSKFSQL